MTQTLSITPNSKRFKIVNVKFWDCSKRKSIN